MGETWEGPMGRGPVPPATQYDQMGTVELRALLRERGIANGAGFASVRKATAIEWLLRRDGDPTFVASLPIGEGDEAPAAGIGATVQAPAPVAGDAAGAALWAMIAPHATVTVDVDLDSIRAEATAAARAEVEALGLMRPIDVRLGDGAPVRVEAGAHHALVTVLEALADSPRRAAWIYGPAGTGKTTLAKACAKALGVACYGEISLSGGTSESALIGRVLPDGRYLSAPFVDMYGAEGGAVFLLDECDAADENVLLALNAALANGAMSVPGLGRIDRGARHYVIAAGNTTGASGSWQYTGRAKLDAAFLDRFDAHVWVGYDRALEGRYLSDAPELAADIWRIRENAEKHKLAHVVSTRRFEAAAQALSNGRAPGVIVERVLGSADAATRAKLLDGVKIAPIAVQA